MNAPFARLAPWAFVLAGVGGLAQAQAPTAPVAPVLAPTPHTLRTEARPAPWDASAPVPEAWAPAPLPRVGLPTAPALPAASAWSQAHEEVARIGGWKAYAREAQRPATPPREQAK